AGVFLFLRLYLFYAPQTCSSCCRRKGSSGMTSLHPERRALAARYFRMEKTTEYRRFAQECRRPAREPQTDAHRESMGDMARAWDKLATEADEEASHALP